MLSNLLENGGKFIDKCNFYIKYFDKIKCYADRPYLIFQSWNLKHTCNFFWPYPTSSNSPDILLTRLLYYMKCQSRKREIIQSNICRILPKVNQVIYTLDTICMPNCMILFQAVLQIFCWQGPLWVKCLSRNRGIIQSDIHRFLRKVKQVIYIMYINCMGDAIILAQAALYLGFCSDPKHFIVSKILLNLLKNGRTCNVKWNFDIKYFDKIKCYADRPYLVFSELKPETHTHIYIFPNV